MESSSMDNEEKTVETTLEIDTKPFGKIKVTERQKIYFPEGLYGFESLHDFYLLDYQEGPFFWLQSSAARDVAFVIIDPVMFKADYKLVVRMEDYHAIELNSDEDIKQDLMHFAIVTIPENPKKMTANLLGPVIINAKRRIGKQALSLMEDYHTKHVIIEELEQHREKESK